MTAEISVFQREDHRLGFGTGGFDDEAMAYESITEAMNSGYRHFDTARQYGTERAVGAAIGETDVNREDLLIATKIHSEKLSYGDVIDEAETALEALGLQTIDLLYVHWPSHTFDVEETFSAFERLLHERKIDAIGGSNFTVDLLQEAREVSDGQIHAVQVEMHPFLQQRELREYCRNEGIDVVAHTPFAQGTVFESEILRNIAEKHDATLAQVVLSWLLHDPIVSTVTRATGDHIRENYNARRIVLDSDDVSEIEGLDRDQRFVDYDFAPWND